MLFLYRSMNDQFNRFYLNFLGIIFGAMPFLVFGVIIATIIQIYSKPSWYSWILKQNVIVSHVLIALFGLFIPVCECGNIPIIKKLLNKGFSFSHAVTFLLAAPIVNPVTIITTYSAFRDYPALVWFRIVGGFVIALIIGLIFNRIKNTDEFMISKIGQHHSHLHSHEHHDHKTNMTLFTRLKDFSAHYTLEFFETMKYLFFGAFLASLFQVAIPQQWLNSLGQNPVLSLFVLILFAFIISVCSNVDAFIGLSFIQNFSVNSILGFLVFGPMIDIKTIVMLKNIFTNKFIALLTCLCLSGTVGLVCVYYISNLFNII
jgi:uncharacterized protein